MTETLVSAAVAVAPFCVMGLGFSCGLFGGWLHDQAEAARQAERLHGVRAVLLRLQGGPYYEREMMQ